MFEGPNHPQPVRFWLRSCGFCQKESSAEQVFGAPEAFTGASSRPRQSAFIVFTSTETANSRAVNRPRTPRRTGGAVGNRWGRKGLQRCCSSCGRWRATPERIPRGHPRMQNPGSNATTSYSMQLRFMAMTGEHDFTNNSATCGKVYWSRDECPTQLGHPKGLRSNLPPRDSNCNSATSKKFQPPLLLCRQGRRAGIKGLLQTLMRHRT